MKQGTLYAKKLKTAHNKFRGCSACEPGEESTDPIEQVILAVLSQEIPTARACKAARQLHHDVVDFNELRVSTPAEVAAGISRHVPRAVQRAKRILSMLNAIYKREYTVSLDSLRGKGVREIKGYLESLDGVTPYVTASVLLWSLGGHAIPVNDPTLEFLKQMNLVDPDATGAEVQAFLERHVSAADAKSFCLDLEVYAASSPDAAPGRDGKAKKTKEAAGAKTALGKKKSAKPSTKQPAPKMTVTKKAAAAKTPKKKAPKKKTKSNRK